MKLLTVNYECPPQGGGAGTVMLDLMRRFGRAPGVIQSAVCGWDFRFGEPPALDGVALVPIPVKRASAYATGVRAVGEFLWRARRVLRQMPEDRFELAHFHFSVPTGLLGESLRGKPFVCSLHGIDVPGFVEEVPLLQKIASPLNRRVVRRASRIFAPSRRVAELMLRHSPEAKIEVIPHGVEAESFQFKTVYPKRAKRLVTIARLLPWKRIDHLVTVVAELNRSVADISLDIYGDGEDRSRIQALIDAADARSYMTMHGLVPKETLYKDLCQHDVFVLPSVTEAFGLVFLEAMAAGLPVVGFDSAGPADIIEDGKTGLLFSDDSVADLLRVVTRLVSVDHLTAELGQNARKTALSRFSWDVIATRYVTAFDTVISKHSQKR